MRIQLWSYNYDPEPSGIGPVSTAWARAMRSRGHEVGVVAAHPHYPKPLWGRRIAPYREIRDGIPVLRLPILAGRANSARRIAQEMSFTASNILVLPVLPPADVLVVVSPSFPALLAAMLNARLRRTPWTLWVQDLLPDGAIATGVIHEQGAISKAARWLESSAYNSAAHIFVVSEAFGKSIVRKGVSPAKITRVLNPPTWPIAPIDRKESPLKGVPPRVICMGNIGVSQGLPGIVRAFESDPNLARLQARLVLTGTGVAEHLVRAAIRTQRVEMLGLLPEADLRRQLVQSAVGAVTQSYDGAEFNIPSKLMNYLAVGLPVVASVNPNGEVARIVRSAGAGWVTDCADPGAFAVQLAEALQNPAELRRRGAAGASYAARWLTVDRVASRFEEALVRLVVSSGET